MENTTYRVNVNTPGLTVFFRNRVNRTPVLFSNVYENELKILELQLKQKSIKYSVEKNIITEKIEEKETDLDEVIVNDEVKIEELYTKEKEPESILDKLIAEDE
jgi:hypothetical protein